MSSKCRKLHSSLFFRRSTITYLVLFHFHHAQLLAHVLSWPAVILKHLVTQRKADIVLLFQMMTWKEIQVFISIFTPSLFQNANCFIILFSDGGKCADGGNCPHKFWPVGETYSFCYITLVNQNVNNSQSY